jgi:sugar phosphate isomerase/epimerase
MMPSIGVQLFTVRKEANHDLKGTLLRLREVGFSSFEIAYIPFSEENAMIIKSLEKSHSLSVSSMQVKPSLLIAHEQEIASFAHEVNCPTLVVSRLPLSCILGQDRQLIAFADAINRMIDAYAEKGLSLAYHHHYWEYVLMDNGETRLSFLMRRCPKLRFVNDVYWSAKVGKNPSEQIDEFGQRLAGIHLRDIMAYRSGIHVKTRDCEIGKGLLDITAVIREAEKVGCPYLVLEQKTTKHPFESLLESRRFLIEKGLIGKNDGLF